MKRALRGHHRIAVRLASSSQQTDTRHAVRMRWSVVRRGVHEWGWRVGGVGEERAEARRPPKHHGICVHGVQARALAHRDGDGSASVELCWLVVGEGASFRSLAPPCTRVQANNKKCSHFFINMTYLLIFHTLVKHQNQFSCSKKGGAISLATWVLGTS